MRLLLLLLLLPAAACALECEQRRLRTWNEYGYPGKAAPASGDGRHAVFGGKIDGEILAQALAQRGVSKSNGLADVMMVSFRALAREQSTVPSGWLYCHGNCTVGDPGDVLSVRSPLRPSLHSKGAFFRVGVAAVADPGRRWMLDGDGTGYEYDPESAAIRRGGAAAVGGIRGPVFPVVEAADAMFSFGGSRRPQLIDGLRGALRGSGEGLPHSVFSGKASDGLPRVVSQFPLAPGQVSLASAVESGACSLHDKASMGRCSEARPGGRVSGVPPSYVFTGSTVTAEAWRDFRRWREGVLREVRAGQLRGYESDLWILKDCRHRKGSLGVRLTQDDLQQIKKRTNRMLTYSEQESSVAVQRPRCVLVQRLFGGSLMLPWLSPRGRGRRFMVRTAVVLASQSPLVVYWNPASSMLWMSGAAVAESGKGKESSGSVLNAWSARLRRPLSDLLRLLPDPAFARGRWTAADADSLLPRVGSLFRSVFALHNATVHRTASFQVYGCDILIGAAGLEPVWIECGLESSRGDFPAMQLGKVVEMMAQRRSGGVCPSDSIGNWLLCK